jgi:cell division cycle protein 37
LEDKNKLAAARQAEIQARMREIEEGVDDVGSTVAELEGLRAELVELEAGLKERRERLEEMERNRKLNVDNVGTVVKDYTFINTREGASDVLPDSLDFIQKTDINSKAGSSSSSSSSSTATSSSSAPSTTSATGTTATTTTTTTTKTTTKHTTTTTTSKKATTPDVGPHSEIEAAESYNNFVLGHEDLLERFSEAKSMDEAQEMLHSQGHILLAEHSQSYLLLSCLEDEMNGKHARMKNTARQSQLLSHITELGHSLGRSPRDVVVPFFRRLQEPEHLKGFTNAVQDFIAKVQKRAVDKRREMDEARARGEGVDGFVEEEQEVGEGEVVGPGGLDPVKVFEALPVEMQEAFESRDMEKLKAALRAMPEEEAAKHMKDCADSGLWVPSGGSERGGEGEDEA